MSECLELYDSTYILFETGMKPSKNSILKGFDAYRMHSFHADHNTFYYMEILIC